MRANEHPVATPVQSPIEVTILPGTANAAARSRPTKATMRVGVAIVTLGLLGLAAYAAVPRLAAKPQAVASRSISLPPTLAGEDFIPSTDPVQQTQQQHRNMVADFAAAGVLIEDPQQGGYESNQTSDGFEIIAVKLTKRLNTAGQSAFFATEAKGYSAAFSSVGPGPYGGQMQCVGASSPLGARCVSIDDAAIIVVASGPKTVDQVSNLTRQIISGVEH